MISPMPMLLTQTAAPFDDAAWCWQLKWDGIRCIAIKEGARARLWSRHGREMTAQFPEVAAAAAAGVTADRAILDGELVVLAPDGRPDFYAVMERHAQGNAERIRRAAAAQPAILMAFDVLEIDGRRVTSRSLMERQAAATAIIRPRPSLSLVESWPGTAGSAAAAAVATRDLEGIVAKRLDSRYHLDYRTSDWRKLKFWRTAEMTLQAVRREPFAALVGHPDGRTVAMVELGWRPADRQALLRLLPELRAREDHGLTWVKPGLHCQVRYRVTPAGQIREPVFAGFSLGTADRHASGGHVVA